MRAAEGRGRGVVSRPGAPPCDTSCLPAALKAPSLLSTRCWDPALLHRSSSTVWVIPSPPPTTSTYPDLLFWTHLGGVQSVTVSSGLTPSLQLLGQVKPAESCRVCCLRAKQPQNALPCSSTASLL